MPGHNFCLVFFCVALPCCFLYPHVFFWLPATLCSGHGNTSDYPVIYALLLDYPLSAHLFISFAECKRKHSRNSSASFYFTPALVLSHIVHSEYSLVFLFWLRCVLLPKNETTTCLPADLSVHPPASLPACWLPCLLAIYLSGPFKHHRLLSLAFPEFKTSPFRPPTGLSHFPTHQQSNPINLIFHKN